ncbi:MULTISPECIES: cytochrome c oxidase subunit I [Exiguobacterium]|uniref:Cytochrome c oxidase subunit 1 n=1 Tax=Exiguobacterium alkaliphilum TaxID=1428684 RepID=A0ABT2KVQ0_9BACL|nr:MULTISPECIES: cytochrome c oxidase subunit I [Exiguobacterium]MCT4794489.1 cytochrome c oxidase subunit I [Exiguobacterium alkaliphilum]
MDWITTVDHKKIGILYLFSGIFFLLLGGIEALLIRWQLVRPMNDFVSGETFNQLITMHGTTMIFLAAMPMLFGFMNAVVPLQIGARDVAFPFINSLGFWLFFFGGVMLNLSWFFGAAPNAGWTAYAPLSTQPEATGVDFYALGLQISGFGSLMAGINFLVTILNMRAPGMKLMRMPLFTWTTFVASALIVFAFPPLTVGLFMLMFERLFGAVYFNPAMGGNVIIWEHLFWIFGHPEVYILILPAFGIFSEIIPTFARKRLFGYTTMVFATMLIGFLGFMVWVHHMFTVGLGPVANSIFAVATMAIAVPTGVKIFNWLFTLWGGQIKFNVAMLYSVAFIPSFLVGGMTGVMLSVAPADYQYHDSYFVVAHFHYVIVGGVVYGLFAGLYYWFPLMFGKALSEKLGYWQFWLFFIGFHLTFFPQHFLGLFGMPRRVFTYLPNQGFETMNLLSTIGAFFMGVSTIILLVAVVKAFMSKQVVKPDHWEDGRTLEWTLPVPTPEYNFAQTPLVKGLDTFWLEKMAGNKRVSVSEPVTDIHMPNNSLIPFFMSLGLFIAGLGAIFQKDNMIIGWSLIAFGLLMTFVSMFLRSWIDDHGYYIPKSQVEADLKAIREKGEQ